MQEFEHQANLQYPAGIPDLVRMRNPSLSHFYLIRLMSFYDLIEADERQSKKLGEFLSLFAAVDADGSGSISLNEVRLKFCGGL